MDLALDRTMIPLGSCTMKLNATTEMEAVTWPEFASLHPFAPVEDAAGLLELIDQLGLDQVDLVGLSMGGRMAATFTSEHRRRVRRLVLVA